ncbi:hypothetical protein [Methylobacterium oryzisoli]|uniref:hypothetical protein n=1 Tax=Methylobacterium oryzisoli TaxID=3385502 RepID=UPI003892C96C
MIKLLKRCLQIRLFGLERRQAGCRISFRDEAFKIAAHQPIMLSLETCKTGLNPSAFVA